MRSPLIVALDSDDQRRLADLAAAVAPHAGLLKVGLQAYTALGPAAVTTARRHAEVFLDLKLHDIPNTVAAAAAAAARMGIAMLTVHACGGPWMIAAACKAAPDTTILAVTVLTSLDDADLAVVGQPPVARQVVRLASMAAEAGAGGVVCAASDVAAVRAEVGEGLAVVVPGIRPRGSAGDDQRRIADPRTALLAGASHLVVGRPVTQAGDPAAAAAALLAEIA
ncbi:MAG: orotidine-5'-phosphate decarboxylase [Actinomycetota bacterium]|nr:orotidine-5'-phosphate decarboxylase [Actinomycetota bacterium]